MYISSSITIYYRGCDTNQIETNAYVASDNFSLGPLYMVILSPKKPIIITQFSDCTLSDNEYKLDGMSKYYPDCVYLYV